MLKQRSEFFQSLMMLNDLFFLSVSWWFAYLIRFETDFFPEPEPHFFLHYTTGWLIILIVWTLVFYWLDFYRPRRLSGQRRELVDVLKGSSLALLIFLGILFLLRAIILSRIVVVLFALLSFSFLNLSHIVFREGLRFFRRQGYNLRHVLLVGKIFRISQVRQGTVNAVFSFSCWRFSTTSEFTAIIERDGEWSLPTALKSSVQTGKVGLRRRRGKVWPRRLSLSLLTDVRMPCEEFPLMPSQKLLQSSEMEHTAPTPSEARLLS